MSPVYHHGTTVWIPALVSVLLHALVLSAVTVNWASQREIAPVSKVQPRFIQARLIDASLLKPKKKQARESKPAPRVTAEPKPVVKQTPNTTPKVATSKPEVEPKSDPVPKQETGPTAEEQRAQAQQELALALEAEDVLLEQASDAEVVQSYVALISYTVQNNWSRPPSARNGMEAELVIQLIPTGEVVSVTVARSSGLLAFDRSAVNAVQKADRFPELQQLPSRVFEKSFRQFRLLFKPEDLRY